MAPQSTGYGCSADIWSFGITLVELATGSAPNSRCSQNTILLRVVHSVDAGSIVKNIPHSPEVRYIYNIEAWTFNGARYV